MRGMEEPQPEDARALEIAAEFEASRTALALVLAKVLGRLIDKGVLTDADVGDLLDEFPKSQPRPPGLPTDDAPSEEVQKARMRLDRNRFVLSHLVAKLRTFLGRS